VPVNWVREDIRQNPDAYTYWFKLIVNHPAFTAYTQTNQSAV
jgi:hypothetical protein